MNLERLRLENSSLRDALTRLPLRRRSPASGHDGIAATAALVLVGAVTAVIAALVTFQNVLAR